MGAVFLAEHKLIPGTQYALKLLYPYLVNREAWHRFQVEARVLARLDHPGIVKVYNFGIDKSKADAECPFYVMEYLDGESLASCIKHSEMRRLEVSRSLSLTIAVAQALEFSHRHGVIHRDVKPSNIIVLENGAMTAVKLVDFGIAKEVKKEGLFQSSPSAQQYATAAGAIFGTPYYLSPEQASGGELGEVDKRSDIYSLGCTLFECLTGRPPFVGESAFETVRMHVSSPVPRLSDIDKSNQFEEDLERIVSLALAKSPQMRYQSMAQFALDLERYLQGLSVYAAGIKSTGFSGPVLRAVQETEEERRRKLRRLLVLSALPLCLALLACLYVPRLLAVKTIPVFTDNDRRNSNLNRSSHEMLRKIGNEALRNENLVSETKSLSSSSPQPASPEAQALHVAQLHLSDERRRFFLTQLDCISDVYVTKYGTADYALFERELLSQIKPYQVKDPAKRWHFRFPSEYCLGRLNLDGKDYLARGEVVLPQTKSGEKPTFYLREGFSPLFLKGFEPNAVKLYFTIGEDEQTKEAAQTLKGWGQIDHLRLAHYKISKLSWRLLKLIPSPVIIQLSDCRFELPDGDKNVGFAKLEYMSLNCPHTKCSEILALLQWAASLPKLGRYELDRLFVDDDVIAALAKLKAHKGLSLSRTIVSPEQLKVLCQAKTISGLIVTDWDFAAPDVLACLPLASHMKTVVLMDPAYTERQKAEIKDAQQVAVRNIVWSEAERARIVGCAKNLQLIPRRHYFDTKSGRFYQFDD
jgi:serine/threonine protein kinase